MLVLFRIQCKNEEEIQEEEIPDRAAEGAAEVAAEVAAIGRIPVAEVLVNLRVHQVSAQIQIHATIPNGEIN
ncbi:MAG: hypothetical protein CML12_02030 [Puniceicoccaceae bacterium]|nr:hypothetical protein [Puniceicoccaceae bacterium]